MTAETSTQLLRTLLAFLAAYHLGIGLVSVGSLRLTARVTASLYGLSVVESPALGYAVRMLGLYALTLGALLVMAARAPSTHRDVIMVVAGLQLARALCRILFRRELTEAFRVAPQRNVFNASLLIGEALLLVLCLPAVS